MGFFSQIKIVYCGVLLGSTFATSHFLVYVIFFIYINNRINALENSIIHFREDISCGYKNPVKVEWRLDRRGQKWNDILWET